MKNHIWFDWNWEPMITAHKFFVFELTCQSDWSWCYFALSTSWTRAQDHAGVTFMIRVWWIFFHIGILDHRHWDHDLNKWVIPYKDLTQPQPPIPS